MWTSPLRAVSITVRMRATNNSRAALRTETALAPDPSRSQGALSLVVGRLYARHHPRPERPLRRVGSVFGTGGVLVILEGSSHGSANRQVFCKRASGRGERLPERIALLRGGATPGPSESVDTRSASPIGAWRSWPRGPKDAVEKVEAFLHRGPPLTREEQALCHEEPLKPGLAGLRTG